MEKHKHHKKHDDHHDHSGHSSHDDGHKDHNHHEHNGHGDGHHNHNDHHRMMIADFKKRFWISLIVTVPVLALAPMIQKFIGIEWDFTGRYYVLFGLSSFIYFYGGWPFLKGMVDEIKEKSPGMMTLIAVAISAAYLYSSAVVFGLEGKTFFWELATLIVVMLAGHWIEMKSVLGASKALEELAALMPDEAHLLVDGEEKNVPVSELKSGDVILIKPGEKVPADGTIVDGSSSINESMITGESKPVSKEKDDEVIGGSVNQSGALKVEINKTGDDTYLSKVIKLVQDAQLKKSKTQKLADRAAFWLTIVSLGVGALTFIVWLSLGRDLAFAMERMITVMVISCPHALGLAIPLVVAISTSISAKNGLLIRNRTAFENSRQVTTIIFDKTGTLTEGSHTVNKLVSLSQEHKEEDILQLATAVEQPSEHHIAKGLIKESKERGIDIPEVKDFEYQSGVGVIGKVDGTTYHVGGPNMLEKVGLDEPETDTDANETVVYLIQDKEILGYVSFVDKIRESSYDAIKTLKDNDIKCILLTGDNEKVAKAVADKLDMKDYFAGVLPDEKQDKVKELQDQGEVVAMTGDGVNDAPALAQADIGIAIGSGTDVAAETADIILVDSDPKDISSLILFGKATYKKMIQNLIWATGYNVIAIPLAAGVLFSAGIMISPAVGAGLMALSTVICAINAQFLRKQLKN
ncbi:copper-translocating P-type ATPase [Nonlabens spongiae]|uniref:Copper-translocating P-type ATPase n=1 Tax=Nonlabens spongiae TaxID=331648 RepID=A0A1W6MHY3_9FLAO|nr:copper-translocating P-type ATPase [Nonlabens spongiae]ARN77190.1 copper-translocating P-type ATPase [Nonlabens spongiae]